MTADNQQQLIEHDAVDAPKRGGRTTLYRLYDSDDALLYIGIASNPGTRFEQHASAKMWWGDVATIRLEHFDDRSTAALAEGLAINAEQPLYNRALTFSYNPSSGRRRGQPHRGSCTRAVGCFDSNSEGWSFIDHPNCRSPQTCCCTCHD